LDIVGDINTSTLYRISGNVVIPNAATGYHGTGAGDTKVQLSDGTGTSGHIATYDATGGLTDGGSVPNSWTITNITFSNSPYSATGYQQIMVNTSGGNVTVNLPSVAGGKPVGVFKTTSDANTVTVVPASGLINGAANVVISGYGNSIEAWPDSVNWWL
jgi:hypothetical protein